MISPAGPGGTRKATSKMQSKRDGVLRKRRPLTEDELRGISAGLAALGSQFAKQRSDHDDRLFFAQVRAGMAQAGRHLLRLLLHGVIDGPTPVPSWLSWSLPSGTKRPFFTEFRGQIRYGCHPRRSVSRMVFVVAAQRLPPAPELYAPAPEDGSATHRHRYVFLEALDWLGRRCSPRVLVDLPRGELGIYTNDDAAQQFVPIVVDWKGHTLEQWRLLYINVAEAAAAVCRHLAAKVEQVADRAAIRMVLAPRLERSVPPRDPLQIVYALQDLQMDALHKNGAAGKEVYDRLFGEEQLYADIQALADRRPEYDGKPTSQVPHQLQVSAVCSGHEAISRWCERVAGVARTRVSEPLRRGRDVLHARASGSHDLIAHREQSLDDAFVHFGAEIAKSLDGYEKDYGWVERSVRVEQIPSESLGPPGSSDRVNSGPARGRSESMAVPIPNPGDPGRTPTPALDVAIEVFRAAHREWNRAIPPVGVSINFLNADGEGATVHYWLPSGGPMTDASLEAQRQYGFAVPEWSSLPHPILRPTDEEWAAGHDACASARIKLASAADALAAVVEGTDNCSRHLRGGAQRLAQVLRQVPPVWPTKMEVDLAFEINNGRIVECRQSDNDARRRREAAEAAATEERRKQKAERLADILIAREEAGGQRRARPEARQIPRAGARKPSAAAIDAVARKFLLDALEAGKAAGVPYVPNRECITAAVSKQLRHKLTAPALFGKTKRGGERVYRHAEFMKLWRQTQIASRDAKRKHDAGE